MASVEEARQKLEAAKALAAQKRSEVQEVERQIEEEKQSLPNVNSQQALRGQKYGEGLQGRNFRQQVTRAKENIGQREQALEEYKEGLTSYEGDIAESEKEISDYEASVNEYNREKQAYEDAEKLYEKKVSWSNISDPTTRGYLKEMYETGSANKDYENRLQDAVDKYNSGVPLEKAFKNFNVDYLIKKGYLKFEQVENKEEVSQARDKINNFLNQPSINLSDSSIWLPRTDRVQVTSNTKGMRSLSGDIIPLVSAKSQDIKTLNVSIDNDKPSGNIGISNRTNRGILGKIWAIGASLIGNTTDIETYKQKGKEVFKPGLGFVSASKTGQQGTLNVRSPNISELIVLNEQANKKAIINEKFFNIINTPFKFLRGEYEWQKKIENPEEYQLKAQAIQEKVRRTNPILKGFDYPAKGIIWFSEKATGRPIPETLRKQTEKEVSNILTAGFFLPAISRGTYGEYESELDIIKKKKRKRIFQQLEEQTTETPTMEAEPWIKQLEEYYKESGQLRVEARIRQLLEIYKQQTDSKGKEIALKNIKFLLDKARQRGFIQGYILDESTGNIAFFGKVKQVETLEKPFVIQSRGGIIQKTIQKQKPLIVNVKASKSYLDLIKDVPVARTKPQSVYNPLNILQKAKVKIKERQQEKLASKQLNVQKSNTILKSFLKLNLSQKQSQNQKQNQKQQQSSFTNLASLLGLASINIPRPTSNLKGPDFTIRDLGRLDKGKTDKPTERSFFYKPKTAYKSSKGKIIQQGEVYVVFARVYGEDTMIGSAYSLEEAKDILRNYLTSNLRASGFVKKKG